MAAGSSATPFSRARTSDQLRLMRAEQKQRDVAAGVRCPLTWKCIAPGRSGCQPSRQLAKPPWRAEARLITVETEAFMLLPQEGENPPPHVRAMTVVRNRITRRSR